MPGAGGRYRRSPLPKAIRARAAAAFPRGVHVRLVCMQGRVALARPCNLDHTVCVCRWAAVGCAMARILLVEDDPAFSYALARFLRADGYEVVVCGESIQALEELESDRQVDILVTDLRLPAGTPHGFSLGRMAKLRRPQLPIIFVTGFPDIAEQDKTPPGPVMIKPIEPAALSSAVALELAQARGRPTSEAPAGPGSSRR